MISITLLLYDNHTISNAHRGLYVNVEMSVNEHVMMSSDQRSSLCHPDNLLNDQHSTALAIQDAVSVAGHWSRGTLTIINT